MTKGLFLKDQNLKKTENNNYLYSFTVEEIEKDKENQITKFLKNNSSFSALDPKSGDNLQAEGIEIQKDRGVRIMPFFEEKIGGTEGFYIAYLQAKGKNN